MERGKLNRRHTGASRKNHPKTRILEDIIEEYCLKRNSFNPARPSPNLFIGKLEVRMRQYYNNLYKNTKRFAE